MSLCQQCCCLHWRLDLLHSRLLQQGEAVLPTAAAAGAGVVEEGRGLLPLAVLPTAAAEEGRARTAGAAGAGEDTVHSHQNPEVVGRGQSLSEAVVGLQVKAMCMCMRVSSL